MLVEVVGVALASLLGRQNGIVVYKCVLQFICLCDYAARGVGKDWGIGMNPSNGRSFTSYA